MRTAQTLNTLSGWVEITHPFHPLTGQRFAELKRRRVSGAETIVLRGTSGGTFAVPREWTDAADPVPIIGCGTAAPLLDGSCLLALTELLSLLDRDSSHNSPQETD